MNDVQLSVTVMHAPWGEGRQELLAGLLDSLGEHEIKRETVAFQVIRDRGTKENPEGLWPVARRAWIAGAISKGTHHIVLQDDFVVCKNFLRAAKRCAQLKPEEVIQFFCMRGVSLTTLQKGLHWFTTNDGVWGGSSLLPINTVVDFLKWERVHVYPECPHDDGRLALFVGVSRKKVWHFTPSLLEHAAPSGSTVGQSNRTRVNTAWIGDTDPLKFDFTKGLNSPPHGGGGRGDKRWLIEG